MEVATGFRFFPTEEELVSFYLRNQLEGKRQEMHLVIPVLNIYDVEPWELPRTIFFTAHYNMNAIYVKKALKRMLQ